MFERCQDELASRFDSTNEFHDDVDVRAGHDRHCIGGDNAARQMRGPEFVERSHGDCGNLQL